MNDANHQSDWGNVVADSVMDRLVSLSKRRGYVFQSSEIYGGIGSTWDYGPLGVELKRNIKDFWWRSMVERRDDIEGLVDPLGATRFDVVLERGVGYRCRSVLDCTCRDAGRGPTG